MISEMSVPWIRSFCPQTLRMSMLSMLSTWAMKSVLHVSRPPPSLRNLSNVQDV